MHMGAEQCSVKSTKYNEWIGYLCKLKPLKKWCKKKRKEKKMKQRNIGKANQSPIKVEFKLK